MCRPHCVAYVHSLCSLHCDEGPLLEEDLVLAIQRLSNLALSHLALLCHLKASNPGYLVQVLLVLIIVVEIFRRYVLLLLS